MTNKDATASEAKKLITGASSGPRDGSGGFNKLKPKNSRSSVNNKELQQIRDAFKKGGGPAADKMAARITRGKKTT